MNQSDDEIGIRAFEEWIRNFDHTDPYYPPADMLALNGMVDALDKIVSLKDRVLKLEKALMNAKRSCAGIYCSTSPLADPQGPCDCGAVDHNAKIEEVLKNDERQDR